MKCISDNDSRYDSKATNVVTIKGCGNNKERKRDDVVNVTGHTL